MILYEPSKILKKVAPEEKIKKLISNSLTVNKAAAKTLAAIDFQGGHFLSAAAVQKIALKVSKQYQSKYDDLVEEGSNSADATEETLNNRGLLVQRVQNHAVQEIASEIRDQYESETYTWLPSDAEEPDPIHQLNYGQVFQIGDGEMPGDRYGCRCGMEIHVKESKLEL